jgi:hypothetical protein
MLTVTYSLCTPRRSLYVKRHAFEGCCDLGHIAGCATHLYLEYPADILEEFYGFKVWHFVIWHVDYK